MGDIYYRHWKKMLNWPKIKMWTEKKLMKQHNLFGVFKLFDTDGMGEYGGGTQSDDKLIEKRVKKFIEKYPHAADHISLSPLDPENPVQAIQSPIAKFLFRQEKYISEGFTEQKSFELAEKEMSEELQTEKYERSLFEGLATTNRSRSLMSFYEQKAEYESRQKVAQLERNLGQFKRYQGELERRYAEIINKDKGEQSNITEIKVDEKDENISKYEPVTYRTPDMKDEGRNPRAIQQGFLHRSERLLDYFNSFAEIKDGISGLSDREIILKANETPQKLKDSFNTLKKKLEKYNIELNYEGKINFDKIKDPNTLSWIKKNERMITICLLCKDLEFELPHKVNRQDIKNKIMEEIESEQIRLNEANERQAEHEAEERERLRRTKINYENYFGISPNYNADILAKKANRFAQGADKNMKKFIKFEEFVEEFSKKYMFDNDLLYETYYYWEDSEEKEMRLRELWINSKKSRLEKSLNRSQINIKDLNKTNEAISELVRTLRRKIDQTLLKNNKHPIFGANYRYYKYNEFMLDSEIEFHKIKKFLQNSPENIKNDPEIGYQYKELINLLQRKKIEESVALKFGDDKNNYEYKYIAPEVEEEERIEEVAKLGLGSQRQQIDKNIAKDKKVDTVDKELGKIKEKIISQFENILKTQGIATKEKKTNNQIFRAGKKPDKSADKKK